MLAFFNFLFLQPVCAGGEVQQIRCGEDPVQAASDNQTEAKPAQREEACVHHHPAPWPCGPHPRHCRLPPSQHSGARHCPATHCAPGYFIPGVVQMLELLRGTHTIFDWILSTVVRSMLEHVFL